MEEIIITTKGLCIRIADPNDTDPEHTINNGIAPANALESNTFHKDKITEEDYNKYAEDYGTFIADLLDTMNHAFAGRYYVLFKLNSKYRED